MKSIMLLISFMLFSLSSLFSQAEVVKFERLHQLMEKEGEAIKVINFWATWCGPCVKELPYFEALAADNSNVSLHLISLDFVEQLDRVNEFINKKNIQSPVLLLDDIDYNSWIDKVDSAWSGAIPATLLINPVTGERKFVEKQLEEGELQKLVDKLLTKP